MNFGDALLLIKQGKKVRRHAWPEERYLMMSDPVSLSYYEDNLRLPCWEIDPAELLTTDWEEDKS
jgi:hypothetical protein